MTRNRLVAAALVVALAMMMGFKCYRQVTMSDRKLEEALKLKSAGRLEDARGKLVEALKAGADQTTCLSQIAECDILLKEPKAAFQTCNALQVAPGGAAKAHAVRGAAYELEGNDAAARVEYEASLNLGNEVALMSIRRLNKKAAH